MNLKTKTGVVTVKIPFTIEAEKEFMAEVMEVAKKEITKAVKIPKRIGIANAKVKITA